MLKRKKSLIKVFYCLTLEVKNDKDARSKVRSKNDIPGVTKSRNKTEDGLHIYTEEELNLGKGEYPFAN